MITLGKIKKKLLPEILALVFAILSPLNKNITFIFC